MNYRLNRISTITHKNSGESFQTPLLVPSFSSKGFKLPKSSDGKAEIQDILLLAAEFLTDCYLISAYDIYNDYILGPDKLPLRPRLILLDSGGYEASDAHDLCSAYHPSYDPKPWSLDRLTEILDKWPDGQPTMIVSYDHPDERKLFKDQVKRAQHLFRGRQKHLTTFLLKPESVEQRTLQHAIKAAIADIEELRSFDVIGLANNELGAKIIDRMLSVAKLRRAMDEAGLQIPIHVFGALDPVLICLYFMAGAEVFDGLTWLRYAYSADGRCVSFESFSAIEYGLGAPHDQTKQRIIVQNYYYLYNLQMKLIDFYATGDFGKLPPHAEFFRNAYDSFLARLGGKA